MTTMSEDFFAQNDYENRSDQYRQEGDAAPRQYNRNNGGGYAPRQYRSENTSNNQRPYRPRTQGGEYNGEYRQGRTPRPRFSREGMPAGSSSYGSGASRFNNNRGEYNNNRGAYNSNRGEYAGNNQTGGYQPRPYRPRTEGTGNFGNPQRPYRPQYNANSEEGGFQPRPFRPRTNQGGYQQRGYGQGGYQQRNPNQRPRKPAFNNNAKRCIDYKEEILDPTAPVRLNKFLANAGICSRRDADKYINAGVVTVNGEIVTELGTKIQRTDEVRFHGELIRLEKKVYVLLNKPKDYVTTSDDPQNRKTVMDLVRNACPERIYPVGRLDRNTTGVLLLTNDGEMASKLMHPKFMKKKIYHVFLDQNVSAADLHKISEGITLEDGDIKADHIEYTSATDKKQVGIEIHSGRNRIVRRIFESLGYHVTKLDRVYFAGMTKKNLRRGDWRYLTEEEVNILRMGAFE